MQEEREYIKCRVELQRKMFPKSKTHKIGEFVIASMKVVDTIEGKPRIHPIYKSITIKGNAIELKEDVEYMLEAEYVEDPKFGGQYNILNLGQEVNLKSPKSQRKFLSTFLTDKQVESLFEISDTPLQLIEDGNKEALMEAKGIGESVVDRIMARYEETKPLADTLLTLMDYDITRNLIDKAIKYFGSQEQATYIILNQPYRLTEISGIGYLKADQIATDVGVGRYTEERCIAFARYLFSEEEQNGNSYIDTDYFFDKVDEVLGVDFPQEVVKSSLNRMLDKDMLWTSNRREYIGLKASYDIEYQIAQHLKRLQQAENVFEFSHVEEKIKRQEERQGFPFGEEQLQAIYDCLENNVVLITAGAGCGKTTSVAGVLEVLGEIKYLQVALSGKAAQNLTQATGVVGSTIHKALGFHEGQFLHNSFNPLRREVLCADETGMIDAKLFLDLIQSIPNNAKLLMLGDDEQLPSIGMGNVLQDMINSKVVKHSKMTKIHRQGAKSGIIVDSSKVRNGEHIIGSNEYGTFVRGELQDVKYIMYREGDIAQMVLKQFMETLKEVKDIDDIQVLAPMRQRGNGSCFNINKLIQQELRNPNDVHLTVGGTSKYAYSLYVGDKVICEKNNYDTKDVEGKPCAIFNGNVGTVKSLDGEGGIVVDFTGVGVVVCDRNVVKDISLGYAISIHKSQGSTIPHTILAIDNASYVMLNKQLLYTGMTRAKKSLCVIGQPRAIRQAVKTNQVINRKTHLVNLLQSDIEPAKAVTIIKDEYEDAMSINDIINMQNDDMNGNFYHKFHYQGKDVEVINDKTVDDIFTA